MRAIREILAAVLLLCSSSIYASGIFVGDSATVSALNEINRIKLDTQHYLYAEITMADWLKAYDNAKILLKEKVEVWLKEQQPNDDVMAYIAKCDENFLQIKAQRGNMYRAFVYLKKSDILTFSENRQIISDVLKKDEPAVFSQNDEVVNQENTTEKSSEIAEQKEAKIEKSLYVLTEEEKAMAQITRFDAIQSYLINQKQKGKVNEYGKYASRPDTGKYYMFIYNKNGDVPACLVNIDGTIVNLSTGEYDSIESYKNCGAIWFK